MQLPSSSAEIVRLLVTPAGAIGRTSFAFGAAVLSVLTVVSDQAVRLVADPGGVLAFLFVIAVAWCAGCLSRKRLHDLGWSGLAIAAFLIVYIVVALGSPFVLSLPREGTVTRFVVMNAILAGPMIAWCVVLTLAPGALSRERRRALIAQPALPG